MLARSVAYVGVALLHTGASVAAFLWRFTVSASQFDGHDVSPSVLVWSSWTQNALWFPLAKPLMGLLRLPGLLGWLPVLLNSALWVVLFALLVRWHRQRRAR